MNLEDRAWDLAGRVFVGGVMATAIASGLLIEALESGPKAALKTVVVLLSGS